MSQLISLRAYARSRKERGLPGGTLRAIQKAIEAERIRLIDGKVDPEVADIQWERNTDPAQQQRGAANTTAGSSVAPPVPESPGPGVEAGVQTSAPMPAANSDGVNRIREAARADAARAELLEYELELRRGNLVRAADVRKVAFEKARIARDALLSIPDRLAPLIAVEPDPVKVHSMLATELRRVCGELAAGEVKPTRQ